MSVAERRKTPRYHAQHEVSLMLPDGEWLEASTLDVSNHGARLLTDHRIPADIPLLVEFSNTTPPISIWASTLHSKKLTEDGTYGLGLKYKKTPPEYKGLILSLLPQLRLN